MLKYLETKSDYTILMNGGGVCDEKDITDLLKQHDAVIKKYGIMITGIHNLYKTSPDEFETMRCKEMITFLENISRLGELIDDQRFNLMHGLEIRYDEFGIINHNIELIREHATLLSQFYAIDNDLLKDEGLEITIENMKYIEDPNNVNLRKIATLNGITSEELLSQRNLEQYFRNIKDIYDKGLFDFVKTRGIQIDDSADLVREIELLHISIMNKKYIEDPNNEDLLEIATRNGIVIEDLLSQRNLEQYFRNIKDIDNKGLFDFVKNRGIQIDDSVDLVREIELLHKSMNRNMNMDIICNLNKTCEDNYAFIKSITTPFNKMIAISQGIFLKMTKVDGKSGWSSDIIPLILKEMKFDFIQKVLLYEDIFIGRPIDDAIKQRLVREIDEMITANINNKKIIFINFYVAGHVNIHLLYPTYLEGVGRGYDVYIYEPHMRPYPHYILCDEIYKAIERCNVKTLPPYVLRQASLPLCYIYVMHFFLLIIFNTNPKFFESTASDDIFIIKFTRDIFKLMHEYKKVDDTIYYLLTNNIYMMNDIIKRSAEFDIWHIGYISSIEMIQFLSDKGAKFIKMDTLDIDSHLTHKRIQKEYYMDASSTNEFIIQKRQLLDTSIRLIGDQDSANYMADQFNIPSEIKDRLRGLDIPTIGVWPSMLSE